MTSKRGEAGWGPDVRTGLAIGDEGEKQEKSPLMLHGFNSEVPIMLPKQLHLQGSTRVL